MNLGVKVIVVLFSILFFINSVNAFVDINITSPGMTDGNYISDNIAGGKVFIDFNYFDSNMTNGYDVDNLGTYTLDVNIYYVSTANTFTADQNLVVDHSLITGTDTNRAMGADQNSYTWIWDTSVITPADGNYFIDINIFNNNYKASNGSDDINVDSNSMGISIMIDNTNPTLTIDSETRTSGTLYELRFSGTDATSGVKKYWISRDNTTWTDNGTTTTKTYTVPSGPGISMTYYVKSMDFADNNSSTATITVTKEGGGNTPGASCGDGACDSGETSVSCPADCAAVCGDGACTRDESSATCPSDCGPTSACGDGTCGSGETHGNCPSDCEAPGQLVREVVLTRERTGKPSAEDITNILTAAGASANAIEKASAAVGKTNIKRTVKVEKITDDEGEETFSTKVTISVKGTTGKKLKQVKIVEQIPKSIAQDASELVISSNYTFTVLLADPIIEFTIPELKKGETVDLVYTIEKEISEDEINEFSAPITLSAEEETLTCVGVNCSDDNPCTNDTCFEAVCSNTPVTDGTSCGFGKECKSGQCTSIAGPGSGPPPVEPKGPDLTLLVIVIVLVVIVGAFYYYTKKKKV